MTIVTSLSIERPHGEHSPFWPPGLKRLVVIVSHAGHTGDALVAHGIDPGTGRGHSRPVFEATLPAHRLSAFLRAVVDGDKAVIDRHCTATVARAAASSSGPVTTDAHEIVVTSCHDMDPGPKLALAIAVAIRSQERLADAVGTSDLRLGRRETA